MNICVHVCALCLALCLYGPAALAAETPLKNAPRPQGAAKLEGRYTGPWVTTNRRLDGTMTCDVTQLARGQWQGRFWGTWQQVPFDYTVQFTAGERQLEPMANARAARPVAFTGAADTAVNGTAMIEGASYEWTGVLSRDQFNVRFTGSRYEGHFELKRVQ
jgi:hypothetical protein